MLHIRSQASGCETSGLQAECTLWQARWLHSKLVSCGNGQQGQYGAQDAG